jgi:monoamine oxidase
MHSVRNLDKSAVYDVVIVGGGLTGLTAAGLLHQAGYSICVLEAAPKVGGRVRSWRDPRSNAHLGDLGPTWVWPEVQPVAVDWLRRLNLDLEAQFDEGDVIVEQAYGAPPRRCRLPGMHGSYRVAGGTGAIVDRLMSRLPADAVRVGTRVTALSTTPELIEVETDNPSVEAVRASRVIVAIPLRLATATVTWAPALEIPVIRAMEATPTWMATQAKAVAVYARPFWRETGLSGRIASRIGPLVEAHDHSGPQGSPAALFAFIGWPSQERLLHRDRLRREIIAQLVRCFGGEAGRPVQFHIADWAENGLVCAPRDLLGPSQHPDATPAVLRKPLSDGRIFLAIAELSTLSPGLIEGALHAGTEVASRVTSTLR